MKRIAFIAVNVSFADPDEMEPGSSGRNIVELGKVLASAGYKVDIYTEKAASSSPELIQYAPKVQIIRLRAGQGLPLKKDGIRPGLVNEFADNMLHIITKNQWVYELIQVDSIPSALVAIYLKRVLQLPYVVSLDDQGLLSAEKEKFTSVIRGAGHLIANCSQGRTDLIRLCQADPKKTTLVPSGAGRETIARKFRSIYEQVENGQRMERISPGAAVPKIVRKDSPVVSPKILTTSPVSFRRFAFRIVYLLSLVSRVI